MAKDDGVVEGEAQPQPKRQPVNLDEFEEFRNYKSARDKREAELTREMESLRSEIESTREQMLELIDDPKARQELKLQRMQARLAQYEQQDAMVKQRDAIAQRWGIPVSVLSEASSAGEMTALALDYLKEQAAAPKPAPKQETEEKPEEDDADVVSKTAGSRPTPESLTASQIDDEIASLREISRGGGAAGARARQQILKLERARTRRTIPTAKV